MSRLHFALHREPDVGSLLFHSGPNIHWGSLSSQTTSFWFDREVIISSKPLPPSSFVHPTHPPPTAGREGVIETSKLLKWLVFLTQHVYMSRNGHVSYDVDFEGGDGGVATINSLMNVRLHTSTSTTTHSLLTPCGVGATCFFLSWDWREGTGDSATGATRTHTESEPTEIHRLAGDLFCFVVLFFCKHNSVQFVWTPEQSARAALLMRGYSWLMYSSKHLSEAIGPVYRLPLH